MQMKRLIFSAAFAVVLFLTLQEIVYSMPFSGKDGHGQDIKTILKNKDLDELYKLTSTTIDQELPRIMKEKFGINPGFNHRIFGHWGFEGDIPFNIEPYKSYLAKYPKKEVIKIWAETIKRLTLQAEQITGLPSKQAKGLVALIYNIHLLGDLKPDPKTNKIISPLQHLVPNRMTDEIIKNLHRMYGNNNLMVQQISKELNSLKKIKDPQKYAQMTLDILKKYDLGGNLSAILERVRNKMSASVADAAIDSKEPLKKVETGAAQDGSKSTKVKKTFGVEKENVARNIKNQSFFPKMFKWVLKSSVAISVIISGYTMTEEIYNKKMAGTEIHPSRVLARMVTGFAGGIAGGILLGTFLGFLFAWFPPVGIIAGVIGAIIGSIAGSIGAEWLFEIIIPNTGLGYAVLDFLFGGVLGAVIGTIIGLLIGFNRKIIDDHDGFLKATFKTVIFLPWNTAAGALGGLFWGGFIGSAIFLVIFNIM